MKGFTHAWHHHPAVRSGGQLTVGERAADRMKNVFATWTALIGILVGMGAWIATGGFGGDAKPYILLNLCLSCIAALQCFILLIAAKRSDQVSSELAQHDYEADQRSRELLETLTADFAEMRQQHAQQVRQIADLAARVPTAGGGS